MWHHYMSTKTAQNKTKQNKTTPNNIKGWWKCTDAEKFEFWYKDAENAKYDSPFGEQFVNQVKYTLINSSTPGIYPREMEHSFIKTIYVESHPFSQWMDK